MPDKFRHDLKLAVDEIRAFLEDQGRAGINEWNVPVSTNQPVLQDDVATALQSLANEMASCDGCPMPRAGRKIYGSGSVKASIVFITLTPTRNDEDHGRLLTGKSGKIYDAMLASLGLKREEVYTTSLIKCSLRKPPTEEQSAACRKHLERELALLKPAVVFILGETAGKHFLQLPEEAAVRDVWHATTCGAVRVSLHPLDLLRDPLLKKDVWEDLKALRTWLAGSSG